ncbi:MAG: hypothetical protein NTZ83_05380, partial [Candidatus Pacearchaeota archaeon]|nr:hypothetical protein [Candidatus Pacearchaeota archaeon]
MKINKKELIVTIVIIVMGIISFIIYKSFNDTGLLFSWIFGYIFISLLLILMLFSNISEEKIKRIENIFSNIGIVLITLCSSWMVFLGIKFHNFWYYLIAVVGFFILIKPITKFRKKIFKKSEKNRKENIK